MMVVIFAAWRAVFVPRRVFPTVRRSGPRWQAIHGLIEKVINEEISWWLDSVDPR